MDAHVELLTHKLANCESERDALIAIAATVLHLWARPLSGGQLDGLLRDVAAHVTASWPDAPRKYMVLACIQKNLEDPKALAECALRQSPPST